jgi:hypothetical protein
MPVIPKAPMATITASGGRPNVRPDNTSSGRTANGVAWRKTSEASVKTVNSPIITSVARSIGL